MPAEFWRLHVLTWKPAGASHTVRDWGCLLVCQLLICISNGVFLVFNENYSAHILHRVAIGGIDTVVWLYGLKLAGSHWNHSSRPALLSTLTIGCTGGNDSHHRRVLSFCALYNTEFPTSILVARMKNKTSPMARELCRNHRRRHDLRMGRQSGPPGGVCYLVRCLYCSVGTCWVCLHAARHALRHRARHC